MEGVTAIFIGIAIPIARRSSALYRDRYAVSRRASAGCTAVYYYYTRYPVVRAVGPDLETMPVEVRLRVSSFRPLFTVSGDWRLGVM